MCRSSAKAGRKAEAAGDSCLVAAAVAGCSPAAVAGCSCSAAVTGVAGCSAAVAGCSAATLARMLRAATRARLGAKTCRAFDFETEERRIDEQYRTNTVCKMSRKARVAAPKARALQERLVAAQWRGQLSVPLEPRRRHAAAVLVARGLPAAVAQQRVRAMHGVCDRQAGRLGLGLGLVLVGRRYDSCQGLRIHNNNSRASLPYLRRSTRRRAACRRPP